MYRKSFIDLYLSQGFDLNEAKSEIDFVLDVLFNYKYQDFLLGKKLDKTETQKANEIFKERVTYHKPIQQIVGLAYFYGRKFFVNKYTLIPRPETEILVEKVLQIAEAVKSPKILDIGSGSGCIPITLALENKTIMADSVDISIQALKISEKNADLYNISDSVRFFISDLFDNIKEKYDVIVSNPPYIPISEKENLQIEVRDFEPESALFAEDKQGIEFYEKIISQSDNYLKDSGYLAFEIGINQADKIKNILKDYKYSDIKIYKDYNSMERVIIAKK